MQTISGRPESGPYEEGKGGARSNTTQVDGGSKKKPTLARRSRTEPAPGRDSPQRTIALVFRPSAVTTTLS